MTNGDIDVARIQAAAQIAAAKSANAARVHEFNRRNTISKREKFAQQTSAQAQLKMGTAQARNARTMAFQEARSTVKWLWPLIWGVIVLFLFVGPGLATVMKLLSSFEWYYWVAIILGALMFWRNR